MNLRAKRDVRSPETKPFGLASGVGARPSVDATVANSGGPPPARILVVEDQDDVRRMMATALEIEGYAVDEAANADEGLRHLERKAYDLVLSDYAMPGRTGAWMLQEAKCRGLIQDGVAMLVTAHAEVREVPGVLVMHKPLDLDTFLDRVRRLIFAPRDFDGDVCRYQCAPLPQGLP